MAQVSLRVPEHKKDEWTQAVEDSTEYDSLTHLVELAVHHELQDKWVLLTQINTIAEGVEFDTSELESSIHDVSEDVQSVLDQMDEMRAISAVMQSQELREVALDAVDILPVVADTASLAERPDSPSAPLNPRETGHPIDIRYELVDVGDYDDITQADVRFALDFLVFQYSNVNTIEVDGENRYYEVDRTAGDIGV